VQTGNGQATFIEKFASKKLMRLSQALDLDLQDSLYQRFIKKQKVTKEKNKPNFTMPTIASQVPILQSHGSVVTS